VYKAKDFETQHDTPAESNVVHLVTVGLSDKIDPASARKFAGSVAISRVAAKTQIVNQHAPGSLIFEFRVKRPTELNACQLRVWQSSY
jgi:hypothetical protein